MHSQSIRFLYGEAALTISYKHQEYLVVGDLHIGKERELHHRGIRISGATEFMANKIKKLMKERDIERLVLLGDIKHSVLRPDNTEIRLIKEFFDALQPFDITIIAGNHDAFISELLNKTLSKELIIGNISLLHGNAKPSERAMQADYLVTAHNHSAINITESSGARYNQKAWLIAPLDKNAAAYPQANKDIKLVVMPAFNELIIGTPVNTKSYDRFNPLFRNKIFDYPHAEVYSIRGELLGRCEDLPKLDD